MTVLALECSSTDRSVALARDGTVLVERTFRSGHSTPLFELIANCLHTYALQPRDIDCLALGLGPGSYTGIRGAIAAAQGWALAHPTRLVGIDSATACAWHAHRLGHRGPAAIVIDAQRGEFYLATFDLQDPGPLPLDPLRLATRADVDAAAQRGHQLFGPELPPTSHLPLTPMVPDATSVALLAFAPTDPTPPQALEPIYLRPTTFVKAPPPRTGSSA